MAVQWSCYRAKRWPPLLVAGLLVLVLCAPGLPTAFGDGESSLQAVGGLGPS